MLGLSDVKDWLKTLQPSENYYIGKLDAKQEKSLGVYQRGRQEPRMPLGGLENKKYEKKQISLLLHWNKNARQTEEAAFSLFKKLDGLTDFEIGATHVYYLQLLNGEPVDVGTDDAGIYERVIEFDLFYERS